MLGVGNTIMIECDKCDKGHSLYKNEIEEIRDNIKILHSKILKCRCGNTYSLYEGIVQGYISKNFLSRPIFSNNIIVSGDVEVIVGSIKIIPIPGIKLIQEKAEAFFTPSGGFAAIEYKIIDDTRLSIISSEIKKGVKSGSPLRIMYLVYAKGVIKNKSEWQELLSISNNKILKDENNEALLNSIFSIENFVNMKFREHLKTKGMSDSKIDKKVSSEKFNKKLAIIKKELNIDFKNHSGLYNQFKIYRNFRHEIAHGENISISKEDAHSSFETAVRLLFNVLIDTGEILAVLPPA